MKKNVTLVVILVVIVIVVALFFALGPERSGVETSSESEALPDFVGTPNPLEGVSELNAVEKANPFKNIKTNPFE